MLASMFSEPSPANQVASLLTQLGLIGSAPILVWWIGTRVWRRPGKPARLSPLFQCLSVFSIALLVIGLLGMMWLRADRMF